MRATNHSNLNETLPTPETLPISMLQFTTYKLPPEGRTTSGLMHYFFSSGQRQSSAVTIESKRGC